MPTFEIVKILDFYYIVKCHQSNLYYALDLEGEIVADIEPAIFASDIEEQLKELK